MDPRTERTRDAVRRSTLEVLSEHGWSAFTIEAVARAARVAKSTIYRHWPTRVALVADALEGLNQQPVPVPGVGTATDRVVMLVEHLASVLGGSILSSCLPALIEAAEHHAEVAALLHDYSRRRGQTLVDVLQEGIDAGELPPRLDAELAALSLVGPLFYRRTMTSAAFPPERVRELVAQVLSPAHGTRVGSAGRGAPGPRLAGPRPGGRR